MSKTLTISEQNILKRWKIMKNTDLGCDVNCNTAIFYDIFENVIERENTQIDITLVRSVIPMIRGIIINYCLETEINIVDLYDLHYINISLIGVKELDNILMNDYGYAERYLFANPPQINKSRRR